MKIFIDNQQVDTDASTEVYITLSVASQSSLDASRTGYSKTIRLPQTARNRRLLGHPDDVNALRRFNHSPHTARVEKEGCTVLEGVPRLTESSSHYVLSILGSGREWVSQAAATPLRQLGIPFAEAYTPVNIYNSWTWDKPVRFLPVQRPTREGGFTTQNSLTPNDYHPFLHVGTILRRTLAEAGYELRSDLAATPLFNSLHISGALSTTDTERRREIMDFKAGRITDATATANFMGQVFASPFALGSTLGNIVDTVDPTQSAAGVTAGDVFSRGGYFRKHADGHWEFAPPVPVTVAFEYHLVYKTDYALDLSTGRITGFDNIYLGGQDEMQIDLVLPFPDKKDVGLYTNHEYRVLVYNRASVNAYRIHARLDHGEPYWEFTANIFHIITYGSPWDNLKLMVQLTPTSDFVTAESLGIKWAIYDGAMQTTGTLEVEITMQTSPQEITPSSPAEFYDMIISGANPGQRITMHPGTSIRPIFTFGLTAGQTVDFQTVAAHPNVSCMDVILALRHMFNLYFYTDRKNGEVYMEPRGQFYLQEPLIDLTSRIDLSRPVVIADPAVEASQTMTFSYLGGDAAVGEFNRRFASNLGVWSAQLNNTLAAQGERGYTNPLFAPSINATGGYSRARSASMLRVGSGSNPDNPSFPMKVVSYAGVVGLPAGELWGWPSTEPQYPLLAFLEPDHGISLAFEDRYDIQGLHRFRDAQIAALDNGHRVTLYLNLTPPDIEALVHPTGRRRDFRARYRLAIGGDSAIYRLEEVVDYNPGADTSTKCVFIKEN